MGKLVENILYALILGVIIVTIYGWIRGYPGYDDTDDVDNEVRSNMQLFIDHGTGCHYLASRGFLGYTQLIPRRDHTNSRQLCREGDRR